MPWWPSVIIRPKLRLARPRFGAPSRPPDFILYLGVLAAVLFVLGGNVYTLVKSPPPIAADSYGNAIVVYPAMDAQLGMEGVVVAFVILIGVFGLGLFYYASRFLFQPGQATRLMVIGAILAGVAFLILNYLLNIKAGLG